MHDAECTAFLQWALPQLELRWAGFRKVRRQVCRRLKRRVADLGLDSCDAYRARLEADPSEWRVLDGLCHVTISRFFRDRGVFEIVRRRVLPDIAARARAEGRAAAAWSAGCASGEEPYTLKILWDLEVARVFPSVPLAVVGSDMDPVMLERARRGCYEPSSLRELQPLLVQQAFAQNGPHYCVGPARRAGVEFVEQDLRTDAPARDFDLVLCRYVAFTYFAEPLQRQVLTRLLQRLRPQGWLVIGTHERLPGDAAELTELAPGARIFRKAPDAQA